MFSTTSNWPRKILGLIFVGATLSHLNHLLSTNHHHHSHHRHNQISTVFVEAQKSGECHDHSDCQIVDPNKICHENKCICNREWPVEHKELLTCLQLAHPNEVCAISEQCLGQTVCRDEICLCPQNSVSVYNPSARFNYCHPKRRLNEECNHDIQCPENAFCSVKKNGCLCQNGYGPVTISGLDGSETVKCLPKTCSATSDCESEYHQCEDNKCKCLATHFNPHTAECYKFGSTGGDNMLSLEEENRRNGNLTGYASGDKEDANNFYTFFKDLTKSGDRIWLVIIILTILTILLFVIIFILFARRHCLGYCWTANKKAYEPNTESQAARNGHLDKNSINNKSFRRKNGETDEEEDEYNNNNLHHDNSIADRSNLVTAKAGSYEKKNSNRGASMTPKSSKNGHHVKVDINDTQDDSSDGHYQTPHHQVVTPLASSTSTPV